MGIIKSEAQRAFFDSHRSNADLVKLFLNGFDITFACEKHISNTFIYLAALYPSNAGRVLAYCTTAAIKSDTRESSASVC